MKKTLPIPKSPILRTLAAVALLTAFGAMSALADIVYVTACISNCTATSICGNSPNPDYNANGVNVYSDTDGAFTGAISTKPDGPRTPGGRYFSIAFSNSTPDLQGITLSPTLGLAGGVYKVYHLFQGSANNTSTDLIVGVTNIDKCTLSFDQTDKFQRKYGQMVSSKNVYQLLGFLTNDPGSTTPTIRFYFKGGTVSAGAQSRLVVDTWKFAEYIPCTDVPDVTVIGPLVAGASSVTVAGVSNAATKITVYQKSNGSFVEIGSLTTGIVGGNNTVQVTGLVKGAQVAATQTLYGQDGCAPTAGTYVGGGANPSVRIALSIRETTSTGPIGDPGVSSDANIHFLGATATSGGAPTDSMIVYPSNGWQTVTFPRTPITVAGPTSIAGTAAPGTGYNAGESVTVRIFAYKQLSYTNVYSEVFATSTAVTSADAFTVNWSWPAVSGADGYRLQREYNGLSWYEYVDVAGATTFADSSYASGWQFGDGTAPLPTGAAPIQSILWNAGTGRTTGTLNDIRTPWGILEAIALSPADMTDTGPYDIYIDNVQNGTTMFQGFELAPAGTTDYGFRTPGFSGSTSGNLLSAPNAGAVVNKVADAGTKSFNIQFQWQALDSPRWIRLTTSGVNNPQVDLSKDISFRLLMQPKGASLPEAPAAPTLSVTTVAGKTVLNWTGGHRLQASVNVTGTYTNVPQLAWGIPPTLVANTWTNVSNGGFLSPWTNNFTEPTRFFRLRD